MECSQDEGAGRKGKKYEFSTDNKMGKEGSNQTQKTTPVQCKEYMTDPDKIYYYQVKAVPVTAEQKKYLKEGEFVTSQEQDIDDSAEEEKEKEHAACGTGPGVAGSLKGDNFVMPDGTLAVNTWKLVGGIWYYFNAEGNRTRGWFQYGGKWYYFDGNGYMKTGWVNTGNGTWYYLNPDGDMKTGWLNTGNGKWYYLNPDGSMKTGWVNTGNGKWYYLNPDGDMKTGWLYDKNIWYYLNNDGSMAVNRSQDGWYLGADGAGRKE